MDIFRTDVFHINSKDPRAVFLIQFHPRRGCDPGDPGIRVLCQFQCAERIGGKNIFAVFIFADPAGPDAFAQPLRIGVFYPLNDLKKPCPAGNPICFETRGNSQTDCFFRAAFVCHNQVRGQRVQPAFPAFDRGIKAFQVDGDIGPIHPAASFPRNADDALSDFSYARRGS